MKRVKATIVLEFDTEEVDDETLKEAMFEAFEQKAENDELLDKKTKIKITDLDEDEDSIDFDSKYDTEDEDEDDE